MKQTTLIEFLIANDNIPFRDRIQKKERSDPTIIAKPKWS